jgi:hypothetical protein
VVQLTSCFTFSACEKVSRPCAGALSSKSRLAFGQGRQGQDAPQGGRHCPGCTGLAQALWVYRVADGGLVSLWQPTDFNFVLQEDAACYRECRRSRPTKWRCTFQPARPASQRLPAAEL